MKRVGIILRDYKSKTNHNLLAISKDLIEFLSKYNILIICIPVDFDNNVNKEFKRAVEGINLCDGIIMPGGAKYYDIDLLIAKYLYDKNIPTLGICLGMQIMGKTFGGNLYNINNHDSNEKYVHDIKISEDSILYKILNEKGITVNSRHVEALDNTNLKINAYSNDNIIEGIEDSNKNFFIGVQWHPESIKNDTYSKKIFDMFIKQL